MSDTTTAASEPCQAVGAPVEQPVRPCPFCGSTKGNDEMGETYRWRLWACECGAKGPDVRCNITGSGQGGVKEARQLALAAWNERDYADMMPANSMRAIAVEAIREATGCPDIKGKDGEYLVDKLERLALLAARMA